MAINFIEELQIKVTFIEMILGTSSGNAELHKTYIASKAPDAKTKEEEVAEHGVEEVEKKEMTIFHRMEDGTPYLYDYQIKGFLKNATSALSRESTTESYKNKSAFKKVLDGLVFIEERKIPLEFEGECGSLQRPLRAETAQGPRVALANSETCPEGTTCVFTIGCLKKGLLKWMKELLDYGVLNGIGQWHNGGYGRFTYEILREKTAKDSAA